MKSARIKPSLRAGISRLQAGQSGFTLIEMMIVIVVMGILLGIAIPAFSNWREREALRTACDTLMAHIKQARHLAHAMNRDVVFTINNASPYSYVFDNGGSQSKTVRLDEYSNTLDFGTSTNVASLTFKSSSAMGAGTVSIRSTKLGQQHAVKVNVIGRSYWSE